MPRPLVYGNGHFLLQLDRKHAIRDLFFPVVGLANHLAGHPIRMGVWSSGWFSWCDGPEWECTQNYEEDTLVGLATIEHSAMGIKIELREAMDPVHPYFMREIVLENRAEGAKDVRLFFTHDLRINESDIGDTALYHPDARALIHYKGDTALLFGGDSLYEFTTGIKAFKEQVGSWLDAEDGHLGMNPISQGSVDSTFSMRFELEPNASAEGRYWIVAGHSVDQVVKRQGEWIRPDRGSLATAYWRSWHREPSDEFNALYRRSMMTLRTQIDNGGAILAANDSDIMQTNRATYSFLWPRDGSLVSAVLDAAGHSEVSRRYFELCETLLPEDRPMFLHKYGPDGSLGASWHPFLIDGKLEIPFQEDESALTVWALEKHFEANGDIERIARWYHRLVRDVCHHMVEFRDPNTGLPKPSWDLWEERRGVHAYTTATVIAGLRAGAKIADALGEPTDAFRWRGAADELLEGAKEHLFDDARGCFHRMLKTDGEPDLTVDSATLSFGLFDCFNPHDPMVVSNANFVEEQLTVHGPSGGIARYQGDYYFRQSDTYPGNPWVICTMWLAQTRILQAKTIADLDSARAALAWADGLAERSGILAEQYHPDTREPLSVSPLTWSHAEVARTIQWLRVRIAELSSTL